MAADLTTEELETLRTAYLYDKVDTGASPKVFLSHYNRATSAVFASTSMLQSMNATVENDKAEELERAYDAKEQERLRFGDAAEDAATAAAASRQDAKFRTIRARVRRMMMRDPGFVGSIADGKTRAALMDEWRAEILEDENFLRTSQGAFTIPMLRR